MCFPATCGGTDCLDKNLSFFAPFVVFSPILSWTTLEVEVVLKGQKMGVDLVLACIIQLGIPKKTEAMEFLGNRYKINLYCQPNIDQ